MINQNQLTQNDFYRTSDLALATTISLFYPIEEVNKSDPHKVIFSFKRDEPLDTLVEAYWRSELKVEPKAYFSQLKFLKSRVYSEG